jgi:hypothetical protein
LDLVGRTMLVAKETPLGLRAAQLGML